MSLVRIAEITIDITCADTAFFDRRLKDYILTEPATPDMRITSRLEEPVTVGDGTDQQVGKMLHLVTRPDGTFCRYSATHTGKVLQAIDFDKDYTFTDIRLLTSRKNMYFSLTDFEYMYTGSAFADRLVRDGGAVLHGSAIACEGQGLIFTAPSGTGKSTHTGLWRERMGSAVPCLNDDKPAIRFKGDVPYVYGTPWSGKTDINCNMYVPLKAIIVIEQAPENALRKLSVREAVFHLTSQIVRPYYDAANGARTLDTVDRLIQTVPCYLLSCTISQEAVSLVHNTLF